MKRSNGSMREGSTFGRSFNSNPANRMARYIGECINLKADRAYVILSIPVECAANLEHAKNTNTWTIETEHREALNSLYDNCHHVYVLFKFTVPEAAQPLLDNKDYTEWKGIAEIKSPVGSGDVTEWPTSNPHSANVFNLTWLHKGIHPLELAYMKVPHCSLLRTDYARYLVYHYCMASGAERCNEKLHLLHTLSPKDSIVRFCGNKKSV